LVLGNGENFPLKISFLVKQVLETWVLETGESFLLKGSFLLKQVLEAWVLGTGESFPLKRSFPYPQVPNKTGFNLSPTLSYGPHTSEENRFNI
jgi:hypothetical protein